MLFQPCGRGPTVARRTHTQKTPCQNKATAGLREDCQGAGAAGWELHEKNLHAQCAHRDDSLVYTHTKGPLGDTGQGKASQTDPPNGMRLVGHSGHGTHITAIITVLHTHQYMHGSCNTLAHCGCAADSRQPIMHAAGAPKHSRIKAQGLHWPVSILCTHTKPQHATGPETPILIHQKNVSHQCCLVLLDKAAQQATRPSAFHT
jgi:hypothetical protein